MAHQLRRTAQRPLSRRSLHEDDRHLRASRPQRCILALGIEVRKSERRGQLYALVIDFTQYVRNRQRTSPRHLYFVANPKGELLIHPYGDEASREPDLTKLLPWNYPEENWFDTSAPEKAKQERLGKAVRSGGARLSATTIPDLGYTYRKGYFGDSLELKKSLPNADPFVVSRVRRREGHAGLHHAGHSA